MLVFFVICYFLATISVGFYASGRIKSTGDYINAGRNLHPAVNTAAFFALWFGSETIFGASAEFAEHGFLGVIEDPLGGVLCLLLVGLFFSKKMYRLNVYTIGDLFRIQYGPKIEAITSFLMIVSFVGYAAAQIVALGLILQTLLGWSLGSGMILSMSIVVGYTFVGGMWAVSITDFLQSILIVIGLVSIAIFVTGQLGGIDVVLDSLTPSQKQILPENNTVGWLNWFSAWMVLGFGSIASQDIFQRVNSARSEKAAYTSTLAGAGLYLIFSMVPLYLVTAIKVLEPTLLTGDLQLALPMMVLNNMPIWLQIMFFGSLISAIMSTCSGALLAPASLLSENLIRPYIKGDTSDRKLLLITKFAVVAIGLMSLTLAFSKQNIFELVGQASVFGLVSIFVPFVAALFFDNRDKLGALLSMLSGTGVWMYFTYVGEITVNPLLPGLLASILGMFSGSFLERKLKKVLSTHQ
jgi:solute:Na+ symporter, SSS family